MTFVNVVEVTSLEHLESLLNTFNSAVVKYSAEWCQPCKRFNPIYEQVAESLKNDDIVFIDVDVDKAEWAGRVKGITSIPTIELYKDSKNIGRTNAAPTPKFIQQLMESNLL